MNLMPTPIRRRFVTAFIATIISSAGLIVPAQQAQSTTITATVLNTFYCSTKNYRCHQINGPFNPRVGTACKFVYFQAIRGTTYTTICQRWV